MSENIFEVKILKVKILSFSFIHKDNLDNPNINENDQILSINIYNINFI